jgi:hypothetical protein
VAVIVKVEATAPGAETAAGTGETRLEVGEIVQVHVAGGVAVAR